MARRPAPGARAQQRTATAHLAQMKMMLSTARSIDGITVDDLRRRYQVDQRTAEYELTMARQRRAAPPETMG